MTVYVVYCEDNDELYTIVSTELAARRLVYGLWRQGFIHACWFEEEVDKRVSVQPELTALWLGTKRVHERTVAEPPAMQPIHDNYPIAGTTAQSLALAGDQTWYIKARGEHTVFECVVESAHQDEAQVKIENAWQDYYRTHFKGVGNRDNARSTESL